MMSYRKKEIPIWFLLYSMIGWFYEVFLEVVVYRWGYSDRGVLIGPYTVVYGFGALLFFFLVYPLLNGKPLKTKVLLIPVVFIATMAIATIVELIASYLCEFALGYWPWQGYHKYAFNFQARIALNPSIRFGLGGTLFMYAVQPLFMKFTAKLKSRALNYIFYGIIVLFTAEFSYLAIKSFV